MGSWRPGPQNPPSSLDPGEAALCPSSQGLRLLTWWPWATIGLGATVQAEGDTGLRRSGALPAVPPPPASSVTLSFAMQHTLPARPGAGLATYNLASISTLARAFMI